MEEIIAQIYQRRPAGDTEDSSARTERVEVPV
jgi:hypothetical protein